MVVVIIPCFSRSHSAQLSEVLHLLVRIGIPQVTRAGNETLTSRTPTLSYANSKDSVDNEGS